ncbi:MAG: hypothetical protein JHD23_10100 [Akkermansiaceae bacterium]|jgi:hypothetical protein|nr:hypothetical protein [Akkermansiaceae bacterium]MBJ7285501.1 hypothetical protein [Akkermansiaceae bacterium]MBJ7396350.1 hypothetical protein [Akkermansiaceae bacterium]MBJ7424832.1 hypothetical protein [Akkermansiaceae bacterium]
MLKVIPVIIGFVATELLPLFGEVIEPQKGMFSPLKNYEVRVISLESSAFDFTKALILKNLSKGWIIGLSQNTRTFGAEWSPNENYVAVFNYGVTKECELSFFKLSTEADGVKLVQKSPTTKERSSWQILKWDEVGKRVLLKKIQEGGPEETLWLDL